VWEEVIEYMGAGLAGLVNILNPEMIILGGGVVFGSKRLMDQAKEVMEKRVMAGSLTGLQFARASLGEDAGVLGAAFIEE
jgi:glucokinase